MMMKMWNFRQKQLIKMTFKGYVSLVPYQELEKYLLSMIKLAKRILSGPPVLDSFYYPRSYR